MDDKNNNMNDQVNSPTTPLPSSSHHNKPLYALYVNLFSLVKKALKSPEQINKDEVIKIFNDLADLFKENLYNDLLLYLYTSSRENYLIGHITNDVVLTAGFGTYLGLKEDDLRDLCFCAFFHDFGMSEYNHLYQKVKIDKNDTKDIQNHPNKSADIIKSLCSQRVLNAVLDVHEQLDGHGYPNKKPSEKISVLAKISTICDVFEALTHPREHRKAFSPYEAIKMIIAKKDILFEASLLRKFVEFMSIYPIGSIVSLNTGETAIVTGSNLGYPTRAVVKILLNPKKDVDTSGKIINLLEDNILYISGPADPKDELEILHFLKPRGENLI